MAITFHSFELFILICTVMDDLDTISSGLSLLKNLPDLEQHLESLRNDPSVASGSLVAELEILVEGLLADTEPFVSFGLTTLFAKGYINYERWQSLQHAKFESDINTIEKTFDEVTPHGIGDSSCTFI